MTKGKGEGGNEAGGQARQIALKILYQIDQKGLYTDIALEQGLLSAKLKDLDRALVTELVYGIERRRRTLDALLDQLGKKKAREQAPMLRQILHLGLYQLRYLERISPAAAVHTSVELAKKNGFAGLSGVVNGLLRQYERLKSQAGGGDPLLLPSDMVAKLGIFYSFPDWMIAQWLEEWGEAETEQLCHWFNQPSLIDLRLNPLQTTLPVLEEALAAVGVQTVRLPHLPQALRLVSGRRSIQSLPGFAQGWFTVQDGSAQLVSHYLAPQAGEVIVDACAAPGGKTTHLAELMGDRGTIWACDRSSNRLKKVKENQERLQLTSIRLWEGDSRHGEQFKAQADRVLLDAPCSGLGTLHKRPDLRWRQTPAQIEELATLQGELLEECATWVKPQGILVYSTCTLNGRENEEVVSSFLVRHPQWQIIAPEPSSEMSLFAAGSGWLKILPHRHQMDGFFLVKLLKGG